MLSPKSQINTFTAAPRGNRALQASLRSHLQITVHKSLHLWDCGRSKFQPWTALQSTDLWLSMKWKRQEVLTEKYRLMKSDQSHTEMALTLKLPVLPLSSFILGLKWELNWGVHPGGSIHFGDCDSLPPVLLFNLKENTLNWLCLETSDTD